jgi:hypothetical protein
MKTFNGVCMVSRDLQGARRFYEAILQMKFEGDDVCLAHNLARYAFDLQ